MGRYIAITFLQYSWAPFWGLSFHLLYLNADCPFSVPSGSPFLNAEIMVAHFKSVPDRKTRKHENPQPLNTKP